MGTLKSKHEVSWWLLAGAVIFVLVAWGGWGYYLTFSKDPMALDATRIPLAGQFGDLFGGVNALFSGLAFAVLIFTMNLQRKELSFQREELKETREVFEKQEKQMQDQNKGLRKQIFESRFFQWLNLHHTLIAGMRAHSVEGRLVLTYMRDFYRTGIENAIIKVHGVGPIEERAELEKTVRRLAGEDFKRHKEAHKVLLVETFARINQTHRDQLVHYFENLYAMFSFLMQTKLSESDRNFYANLLKAQLSVPETVLLFAFGLTDDGKKFVEVIELFGVFSKISDSDLFAVEHKGYYGDSAYTPLLQPPEPVYH